MPEPLSQNITWPGVVGVESFSYTLSHGITPGVAILTTIPTLDGTAPQEFGDLVFGDGTRRVVLKDCKADKITPSVSSAGTSWVLEILDRRWKWRTPAASFGGVSGNFNEYESRGKLVPWTIRAPYELAKLCFEAMGETNWNADALPEGLGSEAGDNLDDYLDAGKNFDQSQTNPPTVWDYTPPAEALARLADLYGLRVVYRPGDDSVILAKMGDGGDLPDGPCESLAATIDAPESPESVGVAGAPIRYQCRMVLEAVGKEWDGSWLPIGELSYRPNDNQGTPQRVTIAFDGDAAATLAFDFQLSLGTVSEDITRTGTWAVASPNIASDIAAAFGSNVTVTTPGSTIVVTGTRPDVAFTITFTRPSTVSVTTEAASGAIGGWAYNRGGLMMGARATDRLTLEQARGLARSTVWRAYRVVNVDPGAAYLFGAASRGSLDLDPLNVPGFGPIKRRQQLVLQSSKVDQVQPAPRVGGGNTKGQGVGGGGILPEFYNGYSRDQQPAVYGSISNIVGTVFWTNKDINTPADAKVYVPFSIDPVEQLVLFAEPVFFDEGGLAMEPFLVLETAVLVRDEETNQPTRYTREREIPGGRAPTEWSIREDVQMGWKGVYDEANPWSLKSTEEVDEQEARDRADYYLDGMASKYEVKGGETRRYFGIYDIDPDGKILQVSWSFGSGGPVTTASTNTEHDYSVLPYPARRRAENLPPNTSAALANQAQQQLADTAMTAATAVRVAMLAAVIR